MLGQRFAASNRIPTNGRPGKPLAGPVRASEGLPAFFIEFLTDPGDTVLEIFAGSNTIGRAAERLDRRWIAFEKDRPYLAASAFRFVDELSADELATLWSQLHSEELPRSRSTGIRKSWC